MLTPNQPPWPRPPAGLPAVAAPADWLTVQQLADLLGMNIWWIYEAAKRGELRHYRFGRSYRLLRADVEAFLEGARRQPNITASATPAQQQGTET